MHHLGPLQPAPTGSAWVLATGSLCPLPVPHSLFCLFAPSNLCLFLKPLPPCSCCPPPDTIPLQPLFPCSLYSHLLPMASTPSLPAASTSPQLLAPGYPPHPASDPSPCLLHTVRCGSSSIPSLVWRTCKLWPLPGHAVDLALGSCCMAGLGGRGRWEAGGCCSSHSDPNPGLGLESELQ